jgi:hypothetical protein
MSSSLAASDINCLHIGSFCFGRGILLSGLIIIYVCSSKSSKMSLPLGVMLFLDGHGEVFVGEM